MHRKPFVVTVPDAYLTPVATGRLANVHRPDQWFTGAVHDADGVLVEASQKVLGHPRGPRVAADPDRVHRGEALPLEGTWLYGGTWAPTFGHFLVETLTTLWHRPEQAVRGLVFHTSFPPVVVEDWHLGALALAGWGDLPVHVVDTATPVTVEELVVPSRSIALQAWAHPEAREVWDTMAAPFRDAGGPDRVHVSRTLLNIERREHGYRRPVRTSEEHDRALDRAFSDRGFEVVHPETLSLHDQLRAVASASVIAGLSGSGLHHSAFIPRGSRVVEIGDSRTGQKPVPMQVAIDAASGHERCFLRGDTSPDEVAAALDHLGL